MSLIVGILIPLVGTSLGSAMVFFMKDKINNIMEKTLLGFASGVMMAAAVFSLILPAMEMAEDDGMGKLSFLPAAIIGFSIGFIIMMVLDVALS